MLGNANSEKKKENSPLFGGREKNKERKCGSSLLFKLQEGNKELKSVILFLFSSSTLFLFHNFTNENELISTSIKLKTRLFLMA